MISRIRLSKRLVWKVVVLLFLTFSVASGSALVAPQAAAQSSVSPAPPANPYGVNLFLQKEVEPWKIEQTLRMTAEANIPWIKQEFPWQEIEFKKNYFTDDKWKKSAWEKYDNIVELADKYHLTIIARIDRPPEWAKAPAGSATPLNSNKDLADFINAFLDHYNGRIKYVQVWNEPNLNAEWVPGKPADPNGYAAMLKEIYPLVKAAHPDAIILSAPMAMTTEGVQSRGNMDEIDYWKGLYAAGIKGNFDIASANGYGLDQPPDAPPDPKVLNFRRVELLRQVMVDNSDSGRPIWLDEYGWNASPNTLSEAEKNFWRHVTPEQQAAWTTQGVEYARQNWPWAGVISIWYLRQVGDIPPDKAEYYFGMLNPDFSPQPVYNAVKADAAQFPGPASQPVGTPINPPPSPTAAEAVPSATVVADNTATVAPPTPTAVQLTPTSATSTPTTGITPTLQATAIATPALTPTAGPVVVAGANNSTMLFVVGGVLVIGGLAALGFYLMRGKKAA
ncbi:MAG: cellulase family glycosylhydrolase [Chloroflexi bacterium]|nr:cellulase family glycosylhydrolase [Chloroflexota bacterium]